MRQDPAAGQSVPRGSPVLVTVSLGKRLVVVPNVVGRPMDQAQRILQEAGLKTAPPNMQGPNEVPRPVLEQVRVGDVLSQTPPAGAAVEPGTTVNIAVRRQ
jgi:serine/threonine-protein kinase